MTTHWIIFVATLFAICEAYHNVIANDILDKGEGIGEEFFVVFNYTVRLQDFQFQAVSLSHCRLNW